VAVEAKDLSRVRAMLSPEIRSFDAISKLQFCGIEECSGSNEQVMLAVVGCALLNAGTTNNKQLQIKLFPAIRPSIEYFQLRQIPVAKPRALLEFFAYLVQMSLLKIPVLNRSY